MKDERALFRNAYALMAATVLTSVLGMGFWAAAARLYDTDIVGRASAAISAMMLLCNAAQLNLSVGLMRFLPVSRGTERRVILVSYTVAAGAGLLAATGFLLVAPLVSGEISFLRDPGVSLLFLVGVVTWVVFSLQDSALTGIRATLWVPAENVVFGLLKLVLLVALAGALSSSGIVTAWVVSMVVMLVPVNWLIFSRLLPRSAAPSPDARSPGLGEMARFIGVDYVGTLLSHLSSTALPLLVIAMAGPEESAVFFVAWTISAAMDFIATGTASSFLVEGAGREDKVHVYRRAAARRATLLLLPAVLGISLLAVPVLSVFGQEYRSARWALVVLCVAAVPRMFLLLRISYLRIQRRIRTVVGLQALGCVSMLGLSALGLSRGGGSLAVAASWLTTEVLVLAASEIAIRRGRRPTHAAAPGPEPRPVAAGSAMVARSRTRG
jgi:O-antigen/teichoic acid export membrane protein